MARTGGLGPGAEGRQAGHLPRGRHSTLRGLHGAVGRAGERRTLHRRHHGPFEVGVDVDVLGLLWGHGGRGHHHPRGVHLRRQVQSLWWGGQVRVLQREQGLLLEQAPDRLLLQRRRWGRLRLRRRDQPR